MFLEPRNIRSALPLLPAPHGDVEWERHRVADPAHRADLFSFVPQWFRAMAAETSSDLGSDGPLSPAERADLHGRWKTIRGELGRVVVGQEALIEQLMILVLSRGHGLVVGSPGVAKFTAAAALARALGFVLHRIRCTPDLTPEDVTVGAHVPVNASDPQRDLRGLLFANMLLVDDLDRLPPRTTSVLHEAIQDQEVIIAGQRRPLPDPFVLFATRYPASDATELPYDPRNDRFMFEMQVKYPNYEAEYRMAESLPGAELLAIQQSLSPAVVLHWQQRVLHVQLPPHVIHYAVRLVRSTRVHEGENPDFVYEWVSQGASPRAVYQLVLGAKVRAALSGRDAVATGDIRTIAHPVLRHRVITNHNARSNGVTSDRVISRLLEDIPERLAGDDQPFSDGDVTNPQQWFPADVL